MPTRKTTLKSEEQAPSSDATSVTHVEGIHYDDNSTTTSDKPRIIHVPREIQSELNTGSRKASGKTSKRHSISSKTSSKSKTSKTKQRSSENLRRSFQDEFPAYFELEQFMEALEEPNELSVHTVASAVRSGSSSTTSTIPSRSERRTSVSSSKRGNRTLAHKTKDVEMGVVESTLEQEQESKDISVAMTPDDEPSTTQKKSYCQYMTKRNVFYMLLAVIMVTTAVVVPILLFRDDTTQDGVERLDWYPDSHVVSPLPLELCHEGYGNIDGNYSCPNFTEPGLLCDIVAQAIINVTGADMALLNIGVCKQSIKGPQLTVGDIRAALEAQQLVMVEISGQSLQQALEQAMTTTFGQGRYEDDKLAYPYAAGLRYDVAANLNEGSRIARAEVNVENLGLWRPLNPRRFYKVVTTRELADGGHGYKEFSQVNQHWVTLLPFMVGDVLLDYAIKHPFTWWNLDAQSYSTHSFVGPEVDPTIATVPESICLEWASDPQTKSNMCSQSDILQRRGGGSCGLVAWSLLDQYLFADIALIQASLCASDVPSGDFVDSQVGTLIPKDEALVMVRLNGTSIVQLLNNALEYAIERNEPGVYPYTAALRYTLNTTATGSANRISSVETLTASKRWIPLVGDDRYSVITTKGLAVDHENGYQELGNVNPHTTGLGTRQAVLDYATEWKVLYAPPIELHSIQGYIS